MSPEVDRPVLIHPRRLQEIYDPFDNCVWGIAKPVTAREVEVLVAKGDLLSEPATNVKTRVGHMRRIAYFVVHGWSDAIDIDIGCPHIGIRPLWGIMDGNHRYVASLIRKDDKILATCSGLASEIEWLQGLSKAESEAVHSLRDSGFIVTVCSTSPIHLVGGTSFHEGPPGVYHGGFTLLGHGDTLLLHTTAAWGREIDGKTYSTVFEAAEALVKARKSGP